MKSIRHLRTRRFLVLCLVVTTIAGLYCACFSLNRRIDVLRTPLKAAYSYRIVPPAGWIKPFTLGFDQIIADYFWIRTIAYFADHLRTDRHYPLLYPYLDLITTLDPNFTWPYYFGGIILSNEGKQVAQSNLILKKALAAHPGHWKFPFYLGFNYWYYYNDSLTAATYLERAAKLPQAPAFLRTFPATLYSESHQTEAAVRFLQEIQKSMPDSKLTEDIEARIKAIANGERRITRRKAPPPASLATRNPAR